MYEKWLLLVFSRFITQDKCSRISGGSGDTFLIAFRKLSMFILGSEMGSGERKEEM